MIQHNEHIYTHKYITWLKDFTKNENQQIKLEYNKIFNHQDQQDENVPKYVRLYILLLKNFMDNLSANVSIYDRILEQLNNLKKDDQRIRHNNSTKDAQCIRKAINDVIYMTLCTVSSYYLAHNHFQKAEKNEEHTLAIQYSIQRQLLTKPLESLQNQAYVDLSNQPRIQIDLLTRILQFKYHAVYTIHVIESENEEMLRMYNQGNIPPHYTKSFKSLIKKLNHNIQIYSTLFPQILDARKDDTQLLDKIQEDIRCISVDMRDDILEYDQCKQDASNIQVQTSSQQHQDDKSQIQKQQTLVEFQACVKDDASSQQDRDKQSQVEQHQALVQNQRQFQACVKDDAEDVSEIQIPYRLSQQQHRDNNLQTMIQYMNNAHICTHEYIKWLKGFAKNAKREIREHKKEIAYQNQQHANVPEYVKLYILLLENFIEELRENISIYNEILQELNNSEKDDQLIQETIELIAYITLNIVSYYELANNHFQKAARNEEHTLVIQYSIRQQLRAQTEKGLKDDKYEDCAPHQLEKQTDLLTRILQFKYHAVYTIHKIESENKEMLRMYNQNNVQHVKSYTESFVNLIINLNHNIQIYSKLFQQVLNAGKNDDQLLDTTKQLIARILYLMSLNISKYEQCKKDASNIQVQTSSQQHRDDKSQVKKQQTLVEFQVFVKDDAKDVSKIQTPCRLSQQQHQDDKSQVEQNQATLQNNEGFQAFVKEKQQSNTEKSI